VTKIKLARIATSAIVGAAGGFAIARGHYVLAVVLFVVTIGIVSAWIAIEDRIEQGQR